MKNIYPIFDHTFSQKMPKTEEQYKEIRKERKEQIKDVALQLFADNGFHNTSIQKIAQKASISKGLIYNYFESKEELLQEIVEDFVKNSYQDFDPNNDGFLTDDEFYFFIEKSFETVKSNPVHWKLFMALSLQPAVTEFLMKSTNDYAVRVSKTIYDFFERKKCKNTTEEIMFFTSLLKGTIVQFISMPEIFPIDLLKNKIIDFYKTKFNT